MNNAIFNLFSPFIFALSEDKMSFLILKMEENFMPMILVNKQTSVRRAVSMQVFLFDYLTEEQQQAVRPILRVLKREAQEELCAALIDYMEFGVEEEPEDYLLRMAFRYLTDGKQPSEGKRDTAKIRPLVVSHWHEALYRLAYDR